MNVYRITCLKNQKLYFGITCRSLRQRWNEHVSEARTGNRYKLYRAIRLYGTEAFTIDLIAVCPTKEEAFALEQHFIAEFNTTQVGYNVAPGGEGTFSAHSRKLNSLAQRSNAPKIMYNGEEKSLTDWAEQYGIPKNILAGRLRIGWPMEKALNTSLEEGKRIQREKAALKCLQFNRRNQK